MRQKTTLVIISSLISVWLTLPASAFAGLLPANETQRLATLYIEVKGIDDDKGQLGLNVFRNEKEMFAHPYRVHFVRIQHRIARLELLQLPPGEYALVAYHDRNQNGKLDHHFLGYPQEAIAYSGGFHLSLFSGMPTFTKLKFNVLPGVHTMTLQIDD